MQRDLLYGLYVLRRGIYTSIIAIIHCVAVSVPMGLILSVLKVLCIGLVGHFLFKINITLKSQCVLITLIPFIVILLQYFSQCIPARLLAISRGLSEWNESSVVLIPFLLQFQCSFPPFSCGLWTESKWRQDTTEMTNRSSCSMSVLMLHHRFVFHVLNDRLPSVLCIFRHDFDWRPLLADAIRQIAFATNRM